MANFMLLYTGGTGTEADPADQERIMAEWGAWYEKLGSAIADGGAPFGGSKNVTENGVGDGPIGDNPVTGYTVIDAESLDAATAACQGHPHIGHGGQVQIFECIDMSGQG